MVGFLVLVFQILTLGTETRVLPVPKLCPELCREQGVDSPSHALSLTFLPPKVTFQGHWVRNSLALISTFLSSSAFSPALLTLSQQVEPQTTHYPVLCYILSSHRSVTM